MHEFRLDTTHVSVSVNVDTTVFPLSVPAHQPGSHHASSTRHGADHVRTRSLAFHSSGSSINLHLRSIPSFPRSLTYKYTVSLSVVFQYIYNYGQSWLNINYIAFLKFLARSSSREATSLRSLRGPVVITR
jgi:hypothetical protein